MELSVEDRWYGFPSVTERPRLTGGRKNIRAIMTPPREDAPRRA